MRRLTKRLDELPRPVAPQDQDGCEPSWWFYMMRVDRTELGATADEFAKPRSRPKALPAAAHYISTPIYQYPLFIDHSAFDARRPPVHAHRLQRRSNAPSPRQILETCVILAINEGYTDQDLEETVKGFERVVHWFQSKAIEEPP